MISRKEDNRGGGSTGRRPLVISGPNRQMLHDISDSLSHILGGKPDAEPEVTGKSNVQIKPELSQSTPNLLEKSNNVTRDGYNKMALQTIRNKLRPFQTDRTDDSNNTFNSTSSQGSEDGDVRLHDDTQEITSRLAKQSLDKGRNGIRIGPGHNPYSKPVKRRPSFEKNYGNGTNNNSERSDSPLTQPRVLTFNNDPNLAVGQGIGTRQITPSPIVNGDQTPPPVPPRAPIITSQRSQTPPSEAQQLVPDSSSNGGHQLPVLLQPPTVITPAGQAIKSVTQNHPKYIAYSQHQIPQPSKQQQSPSGSGPVTPSRGMSPVSTARQPVIVQHASHPISQHFPVQNHNGSVASTRVTTSSGPNITIQYKQPPPPYNQTHTRTNPTIVHIKGTNNEHKLTSSGVPEYTTQIKVDSSSVSTSGSDSVQINLPQKTGTASPLHTQLWNAVQQPTGIVMQSVKSREVKKPLLQTATGPMPSSPSVQSQAPNYISSYKAHITSPNHTGIPTQIPTNTVGDVQIQITRHPQYTPEQIAQLQGRRQIKIHIHNGGHGPHYAHGVHGHGDIFQRSASDTPTSTPRSESPISRQLNQSPMSILSTTSTPSTNSDIPDKPPPPYPGRIQIVQPIPQKYPHSTQIHHHQQHINQSLALHPPPTQQGFTPLPHSQPHQFTSHCDSPQPPLPPRVPLQIKQVTENSDIPPHPPPSKIMVAQQPPPVPPPPTTKPSSNPQPNSQQINGANKQNHEQNDETDETMSTVSDTSSTQEKTRCTSPMPERKPESKENDRMWRDCRLRNCTPQAFKFYMEQHVENLLKSYKERLHRRIQLEREMSKVGLSEEAQKQMRRMLCQKESNYIRLKRARMDKCMFEKITVLGVGAFGEVTLVRKRDVGHLYAMKTLLKSDVLKRNQVAHVKAERDILAEADNEWVVKLYYSFQDRDCLYFVMDYVPGGDLMNLLIKFGVFKEPLAVFYIAELVLAIESVHRMGFTHRDIKPDNILIDKDGHIKLTDFGLCTGFRWTHNSMYYQKVGSHPRQDSMDVSCAGVEPECQCNEILKPLERRRQRERHRCLAHSLVGTPNYIAPEVLLRQGYTSCCDWWSVGVILYEMLVGQPPFYATTPSETQWKVIHWDKTLKIPPEANLTEPAADLIISLCCGPNERLGCNGAGEIKKHSFFEHTSFDGLRKSTPPWKPKLSHAMDTSNFDEIITDKMGDSDDETKKPDHPVNGKHPEHAFFEFTFRRFFDDGGHPYPTINDEHKETDKSTAKDSSAPVYV